MKHPKTLSLNHLSVIITNYSKIQVSVWKVTFLESIFAHRKIWTSESSVRENSLQGET